jgi:hypothetical protein
VDEGGLWLESWRGTGSEPIAQPSLVAVTCLEGRLELASAAGVVPLEQGESAVVPACAADCVVRLQSAYALLSAVSS